jgi:hypothetical protein
MSRLQPDARRLLEEEAELDEEEEGAIRGVGAFGAARQTLLGKDGQLVQVRSRGRERQGSKKDAKSLSMLLSMGSG